MASAPNIRREGKARNITVKMHGKTMNVQTGKKRNGFPTIIKTDSKELAKRAVDAFIPESSSIVPNLAMNFVDNVEESSASDGEEDESTPVPALPVTVKTKTVVDSSEEEDEDDEDEEEDEDEEDDEEEDDDEEDDDLMEEEGQNADQILNNPNATKLQSQYSNSFKVPDVYGHQQKPVVAAPPSTIPAKSPIAAAPAPVPVEKKMTKSTERSIKYVILWKISKVLPPDQKGDLDKLCTIDTPLEELQDIYNRLKKYAAQNSSLDMGKTVCTLTTAAVETMLLRQKWFDLSAMKGWSQSMNVVLEEGIMDGMLCDMLSDATENMSTFQRFLIAWTANGIGYFASQQQAKSVMGLHNSWGPYLSNNGNLAGGTEYRAPPAPTTPVPVPAPQSSQPSHPPHQQPQRNANDLQRKLQETNMLRKQQIHDQMMQQSTAAARPSAIPAATVSPAVVNNDDIMLSPPPRVIPADQIDDYEEANSFQVKDNVLRKRSRDEDSGSETSASDRSSQTSSPAHSLRSSKHRKGNEGLSKTASMLRSPNLNAKIAKAFEIQKRQLEFDQQQSQQSQTVGQHPPFMESQYGTNGGFGMNDEDTTNTAGAAPYAPMRPQFQEGPEKPMNPRSGENVSMFSEPIAQELQAMY